MAQKKSGVKAPNIPLHLAQDRQKGLWATNDSQCYQEENHVGQDWGEGVWHEFPATKLNLSAGIMIPEKRQDNQTE